MVGVDELGEWAVAGKQCHNVNAFFWGLKCTVVAKTITELLRFEPKSVSEMENHWNSRRENLYL